MKPIRANVVGPPSSTTSLYCRLPFRLVLRRLWQAGDILARIPQGRQLDAGNLYRIIERPPPAAICHSLRFTSPTSPLAFPEGRQDHPCRCDCRPITVTVHSIALRQRQVKCTVTVVLAVCFPDAGARPGARAGGVETAGREAGLRNATTVTVLTVTVVRPAGSRDIGDDPTTRAIERTQTAIDRSQEAKNLCQSDR
jgi:hypothetical protein